MEKKKETERRISSSEQKLGVKALEGEIEMLKLLKEKNRLEAEVHALRKELGEEYIRWKLLTIRIGFWSSTCYSSRIDTCFT